MDMERNYEIEIIGDISELMHQTLRKIDSIMDITTQRELRVKIAEIQSELMKRKIEINKQAQ